MKKQNQRLARALKPHGLGVVNAVGHGANIVDGTGKCLCKVHIENDNDTRRALLLLRRRGIIESI